MYYLDKHIKSGLKVGDTVKITRIATSYESNWNEGWVDDMNYHVGKIGIIVKDNQQNGFLVKLKNDEITTEWNFPYFVLSCRNLKIKKIL